MIISLLRCIKKSHLSHFNLRKRKLPGPLLIERDFKSIEAGMTTKSIFCHFHYLPFLIVLKLTVFLRVDYICHLMCPKMECVSPPSCSLLIVCSLSFLSHLMGTLLYTLLKHKTKTKKQKILFFIPTSNLSVFIFSFSCKINLQSIFTPLHSNTFI